MIRYAIALVALAMVAGCSSEGMSSSGQRETRTQMAAMAAQAQYPPSTQPSQDIHLTALLDRGHDQVQLINSGDKAIRDANVWVNGSFVTHVDIIPGHSTLMLKRNDFFNNTGLALSKTNASINKVEVQTGNDLYSVQGPVVELK